MIVGINMIFCTNLKNWQEPANCCKIPNSHLPSSMSASRLVNFAKDFYLYISVRNIYWLKCETALFFACYHFSTTHGHCPWNGGFSFSFKNSIILKFAVHTLATYPDNDASIKMEVGIEDCLHIEFEYNKSRWIWHFCTFQRFFQQIPLKGRDCRQNLFSASPH